jgi:hypothetical protein
MKKHFAIPPKFLINMIILQRDQTTILLHLQQRVFMRHAVLRALLANPKIDFPLSHHGKHGVIYRQAIATK